MKLCGIKKYDELLIISIIANLGIDYSIFYYTFHSTNSSLEATCTISSLDDVDTSLISDKDKVIQMGTLNLSKSHDLIFSHEKFKD